MSKLGPSGVPAVPSIVQAAGRKAGKQDGCAHCFVDFTSKKGDRHLADSHLNCVKWKVLGVRTAGAERA